MDFKTTSFVLLAAFAAACSQQNSENTPEGRAAEIQPGDTLGAQTLGSATDVATNSDIRDVNTLNQSDIGLGGPVQREAGNFENRPLPVDANDRELARTIRVALTTGSTGTTGVIAENQLTKIQVSAKDGVVTLSGPVVSEEEKRIIEGQVSGMPGVKSVVNNLQVLPGQRADTPLQPLYPRTPGNE